MLVANVVRSAVPYFRGEYPLYALTPSEWQFGLKHVQTSYIRPLTYDMRLFYCLCDWFQVPFRPIRALLLKYYAKPCGKTQLSNMVSTMRDTYPGAFRVLFSVVMGFSFVHQCKYISLDREITQFQYWGLQSRANGDTRVFDRCGWLLICPSCGDSHSMVVAAPTTKMQPNGQWIYTKPIPVQRRNERNPRQKTPKPYTASSVAGFSKIVVDVIKNKIYCGRKTGLSLFFHLMCLF
jgi:hypothetical protein